MGRSDEGQCYRTKEGVTSCSLTHSSFGGARAGFIRTMKGNIGEAKHCDAVKGKLDGNKMVVRDSSI